MALLRLPDSMPVDLKLRRVDEVVSTLELNKCVDTRMGGTFVTGLSGGERKRASIACELLTNPSLLVLDEPTSGLDSAIAFSLMSTLDSYARIRHKTVITTIHQPSSQMFHMFTNVLLLNTGQVAYFGAGSKIVDFFAELGMRCGRHYNPADFILEQLKASPENSKKLVDAALQLRHRSDWPVELSDVIVSNSDDAIVVDDVTQYCDSEVKVIENGSALTSRHRIDSDNNNSVCDVDVDAYVEPDAVWQTSFCTQYWTLTRRNFMRQRDRYLSLLHLGQTLFMALFAGLVWFRTPRNEQTATDRLGILFFVVVQFGFLPGMDAITALTDETGVFRRERATGLYRLSAYYLAVMTTELPVTLVLTTVYVIINYWMVHLMPHAVNFIAHWLILALSSYTAQSFGMLISVVITSQAFKMSFCNTFLIGSLLAGGYFNTHIASWFRWIRYLSFIYYALSATAKIEFRFAEPFQCDPDNTVFPDVCTTNNTLIDGHRFLQSWDLDATELYVDLLALAAMLVTSRILAYFVLRFLRRPST